MERVYTIIFCVGVIYTVVTFLIGGLFGIIDIGIDVNIDGHLDGGNSSIGFPIFPLKPITIVSFITVFGGVGIIGTRYKFNWILVFAVAVILGLIISAALYSFIVVPLYKAQNTSSVSQDELIGMTAVVISPIFENGFGTIAYVVNGRKYNAPAQHVAKKAVKQGEEVLIYEIKNNVFYIEPLNNNQDLSNN